MTENQHPQPFPSSATTEFPYAVRAGLALLSLGAAAIHFAYVVPHLEEDWTHGAFFALVAWAQLLWGIAVLVRPSRTVLRIGALGSLAVVAVWACSRTIGMPIGAEAWVPEPLGFADALASAFELAIVFAALAVNRPRAPAHAGSGRPAVAAVAVLGVAVVALSTLSLTPSFASAHEHHHDEVAEHSHADARSHDHGAEETGTPAADEQAAADELVAATKAATAKYASLDAAVADGYVPLTPPDRRVVHYHRPEYQTDDAILDADRIESLVYVMLPGGRSLLLGAMYMVPPGVTGPDIGGPLTHWHVHDNLCLDPDRKVMVGVVAADGSCPDGSVNTTTPEMLHVWVIDHPDGPFAELNSPGTRQAVLAALGMA